MLGAGGSSRAGDDPATLAYPDGGIVDAHHHLWALDRVDYPWLRARGERRFFGDPTPIQVDYGPEQFFADTADVPIAGSVHIQVGAASGQEVPETVWLEEQAQRTGLPSAIVAYADLTSDSLERTLDHHQQASGRIRGIRQIISRRADEDVRTGSPALLNDPAFLRGLRVLARRGLSFDLQLTPPLLRRACAVLEEVAELPVALCHAGSPWDQSAAGIDAWAQGLARFAQLPHSVCKLSGWGMFDPAWTGTSLAPFFDHAIAAFGTTRLLWGSNYPVDKLYRGYREICRTSLSLIPDQDRAATFNQNARRFYRIGQG